MTPLNNMPPGYDKAQADYDNMTPKESTQAEKWEQARLELDAAQTKLGEAGGSLDEAVGGNEDDTLWRMYASIADTLDALIGCITNRIEDPNG